jgi:hypothetical protein
MYRKLIVLVLLLVLSGSAGNSMITASAQQLEVIDYTGQDVHITYPSPVNVKINCQTYGAYVLLGRTTTGFTDSGINVCVKGAVIDWENTTEVTLSPPTKVDTVDPNFRWQAQPEADRPHRTLLLTVPPKSGDFVGLYSNEYGKFALIFHNSETQQMLPLLDMGEFHFGKKNDITADMFVNDVVNYTGGSYDLHVDYNQIVICNTRCNVVQAVSFEATQYNPTGWVVRWNYAVLATKELPDYNYTLVKSAHAFVTDDVCKAKQHVDALQSQYPSAGLDSVVHTTNPGSLGTGGGAGPISMVRKDLVSHTNTNFPWAYDLEKASKSELEKLFPACIDQTEF